jgi:predicted permease
MRAPGGWRRFFCLGESWEEVEREVEEELRFHMEELANRFRKKGLPEDEIASAVRRRFGNLERIREDLVKARRTSLRSLRRRQIRRGLGQDLRLSIRLLRKRPVFAAVIVLTLALGIGANSAIFSILKAVVFTPLPYFEPDRLMTVWTPQEGARFNPLSGPDWIDIRDRSDSFEAWGVYEPSPLNLSGEGLPEQVEGLRVSHGLLQALGTEPTRGRFLTPEESEDPGTRVLMVSHDLWERRFGADPELLGKEILVDQEPWTVVGILPRRFRFPGWQRLTQPDLFMPLFLRTDPEDRGSYYLRAIGRLREGRSRKSAQEELETIAAALAKEFPDTNARRTVQVVPLEEVVLGDSPRRIWILLGATGFLLLLACANVGGLLLSRNAGRSVEMAVRVSMGAGRGRLMRLMLTESLTLALLGGAVGLLLAWWGSGLLSRFLPGNLPRASDAGIDGTVILVTVGAALLTSILAGVLPALATSTTRLQGALREGTRTVTMGGSRGRLLGAMIATQVALTFVLADSAALMLQNLREVTSYRELTSPEEVLFSLYLEPQKEAEPLFVQDPFQDQLLSRVRGLPGVQGAGVSGRLPFESGWSANLLPEGAEYDPVVEVPGTHIVPVSEGYFGAAGIQLLRGRDFLPEDTPFQGEGRVGVAVNQAFAARSWPGEDPLGKGVRANMAEDPWLDAVVVAVVENVRQYGLESTPDAEIYLPVFPSFLPNRWLVVRAEGEPLALAPALRQTLADLDPHRPLTQVFTGADLYESLSRGRRATTRLIGIFALLALGLVAAGTYGVMNFLVEQRTQEMGIRVALGAQRTHVVWQVLRKGLALCMVGIAVGLVGLWGISGVVQSLLFQAEALSPSVMVVAAFALLTVALAATGLPALRTTRADPVNVMRN